MDPLGRPRDSPAVHLFRNGSKRTLRYGPGLLSGIRGIVPPLRPEDSHGIASPPQDFDVIDVTSLALS